MAKPRKGWTLIQVALPVESVQLMKFLAVLRNETHGEVLNSALTMAAPKLQPSVEHAEGPGPFGTQEAVKFLAPFYGPGGLLEKKPTPAFVEAVQALHQEKASHRPKKTPKVKTRPGPKEAPKEGEEITLKAEAYGWNFDRLVAALASVGVSHGQLAKHLGLTNISPWGKTGIPPKWLPATHAFLLSKGWQPEADQRTIFDAKD